MQPHTPFADIAIAEATGENFEISFILPDEIEEEIIEKFNDLKEDDVIEAYTMVEVPR